MRTERERRRVVRRVAAIPVELETGPAVTRDLSTIGVFIETADEMAIGSELGFTLDLGEDAIPLRCSGTVVRNGDTDGPGVGVRIDGFGLEEKSESKSVYCERQRDDQGANQKVRGRHGEGLRDTDITNDPGCDCVENLGPLGGDRTAQGVKEGRMRVFNLRKIVFVGLVVIVTTYPLTAETIVYEVSGQFVAVGPSGQADLDGAEFRLSVSIDGAAIETFKEQNVEGQWAVYDSTRSMLEILNASDPAMEGVYDAITEQFTVRETYGADYCLEFGSLFHVRGTTMAVPAVCFPYGTASGIRPPVDGIGPDSVIGFQIQRIGNDHYAVVNGLVQIVGGER